MKEKIVLVGAGGHCKILLESLNRRRYEIVGILDNNSVNDSVIGGIPVIGRDCDAEALFCSGVHNAVITLVGDLQTRRKLLEQYKKIGFSFPTILHPSAYISSSAYIGEGAVVLAGAYVNAEAKVQDFATVNTGAIIEHDSIVGENAHIAPGAILLGASQVGKDSLLGAGSTVLQQITVGEGCTVGAGSIVLKDVKDNKTVYGNPAREKEKSEK